MLYVVTMPEAINQKTRYRLTVLVLISIVVLLLAAALPPISQSYSYHQFADQRFIFGIPNFMNVVSNLAILLSGVAGLIVLWRSYKMLGQYARQQVCISMDEYWPYLVLFTSVILTALGSAYYHWAPDNDSLLWDRLPIATGITALLAIVLSERIHPKLGLWVLPVLVFMGAGSVMYWYWGEQQGAGNLNFYIVIQFYSLLLVVLLSVFLPPRYTCGNDFYTIVGLYALAKLAEMFDQQLFNLGQLISGHTVKHLLAAVAVGQIIWMLKRRKPEDGNFIALRE